ncbi:site-specific integrase [Aristaeella lactis]|uniref:Site-specific recombinase XerD n=2 Tax=Aristaeella lactis TaxID=3046383 RepID=A0AC61PLR1_9FIRM|nr:site-specific integrase [Aristaeella lactis]QUA54649.1 site-specific integrase [Aristaeella lactis]SMC63980.1 Site-specific recombinase XerD [Aristaeella lactis]
MPAYKDQQRKTWTVKLQYKNWEQKDKYVCKRGFRTKHEADEWEESFLRELKQSPDITFGEFWEIYKRDRKMRVKQSTWDTKESIVEQHILPFFRSRLLREITTIDIMSWQNHLLMARVPGTGEPYSSDYLRTVHNQLSCILNHGVKYYKLKDNPAMVAGNMGKSSKSEMQIWTQYEFQKFIAVMMDKPILYYAYEVLYWMGIRKGELLALTKADVDLEKRQMRINKTLYSRGKVEMVTSPKTPESNRTISIPQFLADELAEYFSMNYDLHDDDRIFPVKGCVLSRQLNAGAEKAGLKRIRVHDLRHSHVSLLINVGGFNAIQIARRVGHSSIDITYRYAHLFPGAQADMANRLDEMKGAMKDV